MYIVPYVPLIPQSRSMACWYAAAQMVIQWKRELNLATLADHPDPSQVDELTRLYDANGGLPYSHVPRLAALLGLRAIAPLCVSAEQIETWLRLYGPLWTHGAQHIVVIAGASGRGDKIFVHDPWPPNVGRKEWRSYSEWFVRGHHPDSLATTPDVRSSFMHHP